MSNDPNDFYKALNETCDHKKDYSIWKGFKPGKSGNESSFMTRYCSVQEESSGNEITAETSTCKMLDSKEISKLEKVLKNAKTLSEQRNVLQEILTKMESKPKF